MATSLRWPIVGDAQIFNYWHLLIEHGILPYRDVPDINLPGSHLLTSVQIALYGPTALGARLYDFTLLGLLTGAMIAIAAPWDWAAGLLAATLFVLQHAAVGGALNAGERDEVMAVLIMLAFACLFYGVRRQAPMLMFPFGLALGFASTLKPTVLPLELVLLLLAAWHVSRRGADRPGTYIAWAAVGTLVPFLGVLLLLVRFQALSPFLECMRVYTPFYAGMARPPLPHLLRRMLPFGLWILVPFAAITWIASGRWREWETGALLIGALFGATSYLLQGKGFSHHTYPLVACLLVACAVELVRAAGGRGRAALAALAGLGLAVFLAVPAYWHRLPGSHPDNGLETSLEADLARLGGRALSRRVECLDIMYGCYGALTDMGLVENTPLVGDILLFTPERSPVVDRFRSRFWEAFTAHPPSVIVMTNEWLDRPASFERLRMWPAFSDYLAREYALDVQRGADDWGGKAYRIYLRRGQTLSAAAGPSTGRETP